ncbi:hypothetical protein PSCICN_34130 [Pseudomonas cichorii]|uniref:hypothetical protein n=1 Tax=Pseudomonas cichorii TaxID=36746 RepID=UPI001910F6AF|nr:hypothetical protein [Pseudomonas cichorii]GFM82721.1 hypothetical protein PSCICN_34130 [Pseudomonas cichorii]
MGQMKEILESFTEDTAEEARQHVSTLFQLGTVQGQLFENQIKNSLRTAGLAGADNQSIPISSIISQHSEVHAHTSTAADDHIIETIQGSLKNFVAGGSENIITGISVLLQDALKTFLGESFADSKFQDDYLVMADGAALVRIDYRMWYYTVHAQSIQKSIERIVVMTAVKSAVDVVKIDLNTFICLYQEKLNKAALITKKKEDENEVNGKHTKKVALTEEDIIAEIGKATTIIGQLRKLHLAYKE